MEPTYKNANLFHKYLWNEVDFDIFKIHLHKSVGNIYLSKEYMNEKWDQFQRGQMKFTVTFDERFFNACLSHMHEINYKG